MRCSVTLHREADQVVARSAEYPACTGRGATAEQALERLRASVLFWLEACPCDQTADQGLNMVVVSDNSRTGG